MLTHPFPPLYSGDSKKLILGSFPSVKSRDQSFYYGHERNRFWQVLATLYNEPVPQTIEEKRSLVLSHDLALWDVIASCDITGSADSTVKNATANDIGTLLANTKIEKIFVNGKTAAKLYEKLILPSIGIEAIYLPSTSPANAAFSVERLIEAWRIVRD